MFGCTQQTPILTIFQRNASNNKSIN